MSIPQRSIGASRNPDPYDGFPFQSAADPDPGPAVMTQASAPVETAGNPPLERGRTPVSMSHFVPLLG